MPTIFLFISHLFYYHFIILYFYFTSFSHLVGRSSFFPYHYHYHRDLDWQHQQRDTGNISLGVRDTDWDTLQSCNRDTRNYIPHILSLLFIITSLGFQQNITAWINTRME